MKLDYLDGLTLLLEPLVKEASDLLEKPCKLTLSNPHPLQLRVILATNDATTDIEALIDGPQSTSSNMFNLSEFPGNCGMCISHGTSLADQDKGLGQLLQKYKALIAKKCGYTRLIATTLDPKCSGTAAGAKMWKKVNHILQKHGWEQVPDMAFQSRRTLNHIITWRKELQK